MTHVWVGDRAYGAGMLGTDAGDTAEVLTDGFCEHPLVERSIRCASSARLGAAGRTGMIAESQGITLVTSNTRYRWRHLITSSGSMRLSDQPKDPERNARTVQTSSLVSAESGPTVSGSRADGRHDAHRSSVDQAEGPGHHQLNHVGHTCHAMTRVAKKESVITRPNSLLTD